MRKILTIGAIFAFAGTAWAAGPDAKVGGEISKQCAACHGNDGMSVDNNIPNLAGQHYTYLLEQMNAYKQKTRDNPIMNEMIGPLNQTQITDIAAYFSNIPVRVGLAAQPKK
jgi:cytochrome c553